MHSSHFQTCISQSWFYALSSRTFQTAFLRPCSSHPAGGRGPGTGWWQAEPLHCWATHPAEEPIAQRGSKWHACVLLEKYGNRAHFLTKAAVIGILPEAWWERMSKKKKKGNKKFNCYVKLNKTKEGGLVDCLWFTLIITHWDCKNQHQMLQRL